MSSNPSFPAPSCQHASVLWTIIIIIFGVATSVGDLITYLPYPFIFVIFAEAINGMLINSHRGGDFYSVDT